MRSARGPGMNHLGSFEPGALDTPSQSPAILVVAGARRFRASPLCSAERITLPLLHWSESPQVRKSASPTTHFVRFPDSGLRTPDFRTFGFSDFWTFGFSDFWIFGRYRQTEFANRAARPARERASSVAASEKPSAIAHSSAHSTLMAEARAMRKNRCWLAEPRS